METKWTDEQLLAIETRGKNLLVAAAAGSGKTAVLVERIIKIITDDNNPVDIDKLLVVTFTNAAASEMRERIGDAISKKLEEMPDSKMLQRQLALLNKSNITTIHSFCLDIIKNNFHLIDLDPGFRIGDETECTLIKQDVLIELFEDKYDKEDEDFLNLIEAYCTNRDDERLKEIVLKLYNFSMSGPWPSVWLREKAQEFNINSLDELEKASWYKVLKESLYLDLNNAKNGLDEAIKICEEDSDLAPYLLNLKPELNGIENAINSLNLNLEQIYKAIKDIEFAYRIKTVKKGLGDELDKKKVKSLRDDVKKKINQIKGGVFSVSLDETLNGIKNMYPIIKSLTELVIEFSDRYVKKKMERVILDFNDLEHLCLKILTCNDENGEVYASSVAQKFREKFEEVLVDEYQDSNNVQETIISMVSRKDLDNPNVFMVGDVKQSIYRFRQAKPELFLEKYNSYSEEDNKKNRKIMLYKNFRSRKEVIDSCNYIFENIMSKNIGEIEYIEDEALNLGASFKENLDENVIVAGPTEIHLMEKAQKQEEEPKDEEYPEEELDNIQLEARMVGKIIKNLMSPDEEGKVYKVYDKKLDDYRVVDFKDIVILLRATSAWAPVFADELINMGIPTYADTGMGYFDTIEIKTVMAFLRIIDNPMQDIPLLSVLKSPILPCTSFTPEDFIDIRLENQNTNLYECIRLISENEDEKKKEIREKCRIFLRELKEYKEKSLYMSTDEFLWHLYMKSGYYAYVGALPSGSQRQANLKILFERAKQFEETSFKGIFNFINFIDKIKKSNSDMGSAKTLGENANVVRIMSIHKSKGLEFPIVFCSAMSKNFNTMDFKKDMLYHYELGFGPQLVDIDRRISYPSIAKEALKYKMNLENLSEEMRILYVALTRAKEKLILTGAVKDIPGTLRKWGKNLDGDNPVSQYDVLKAKNYLDWIMPSVLKHKDFKEIRKDYEIDAISQSNHDSKWSFDTWQRDDVIVEEKEEETNIESLLSEMEEKSKDVDYTEEIREKLNYSYPYKESVKVSASISVSEIKKMQSTHEEDYSEHMYEEKVTLKRPLFIQEDEAKNKISPQERGTIVHLVMEVLDLNRINTINEIKEQIEDLIKREIISEKQSLVINPFKIYKFFKSEIGKRVLSSHFIKREQSIYSQIKMNDIYLNNEDIQNNRAIYEEESLMLRGIIDLYFEEDDEIVIVDYKTDYITEENKQEVIDRYKKQLDLYAEALTKLTGKKVKEKYLYLFNVDEAVKLEED